MCPLDEEKGFIFLLGLCISLHRRTLLFVAALIFLSFYLGLDGAYWHLRHYAMHGSSSLSRIIKVEDEGKFLDDISHPWGRHQRCYSFAFLDKRNKMKYTVGVATRESNTEMKRAPITAMARGFSMSAPEPMP